MKNTVYRILFVAVVVLLAAGILVLALHALLPDLLSVLRDGDAEEIETYLRHMSTWQGILCAALLQILQVWSVVLSGAPVQIAAGVVYGTWGGFAICDLASALAHTLELAAIRRLGGRLEKWLPGENRTSRLEALLRSDCPAYTVVLSCLNPLMPNGAIPLVAARTRLTPRQYFLAILGGSIPTILLRCAIGSQLLRGNWLSALAMAACLLAVVVPLWLYQERVLAFLRRVFPRGKR